MMPSLWVVGLKTSKDATQGSSLLSKIIPNITNSSDSLQTVPFRVNRVNWRQIASNLETIIALVLTCIQITSPQVTPLTNVVKITIQGFCNSFSLTRGYHYLCQQIILYNKHVMKCVSFIFLFWGPLSCKGLDMRMIHSAVSGSVEALRHFKFLVHPGNFTNSVVFLIGQNNNRARCQ